MFSSKIHRNRLVEETCDDHIYENIASTYKYRIFNGIISKFSSKKARKRDINIQNVDYCPSMNEYSLNSFHTLLDDDTSIFEKNFEYQMDFENSYTSCEDDNIYENLEFFDDDNFNNKSLNEWIMSLSSDVADYETENIMFVKSIPSVLSVKRNSSFFHRRQHSKTEITLNFLKILWNGENNVDIMSLLLQTFSNLLRDQNKQRQSSIVECSTDCSSLATKTSSPQKLKKSRKRIYQQKFETVILSLSLNRLAITYNKSQKFYFILASSDILERLPAGVKVNEIIGAIRNCFKFSFRSKFEVKEFYKVLKILLRQKLSELAKIEQSSNTSAIENIYQQIWTCQSISNSHSDDKAVIINSENIYSSLEYPRVVSDESLWEVDNEFSFMNVVFDKMMNNSYYKTIWICYNEENPEYNKLFYDETVMKSLYTSPDVRSMDDESIEDSQMVMCRDVTEIPKNWCDSVDAWKSLIRSPYYCEDEEDILVNESILSSNFSYYNDTEDDSSKSVTVHSSNFSLQLDESSSIKSSHESYRSLNEDVFNNEKVLNSPKKEREKFRDRFKSKLKLKTGKLVIEGNSNESIASKSDDDPDRFLIFGCNLEKVEKDSYNKNVPKIIVECINILELDVNIKTSGIYRISGNKTTIDAIRKKFNEKKHAKKESRHVMLQDQDVHTLTGLLKMFFRELKPPLMTRQIFTQCTDKHSADEMGKILRELPIYNYATLKYLYKHLKMIEKYQNENLMNSGNLAICLGLCLFSNSFNEASNPFENDISKCNMLCKYLIDNYYDVFESIDR